MLVEDLASTASLSRIVNEIQAMIKRTIPIRFGLIALVEDDNSACKLIIYTVKTCSYIYYDITATVMARALYYLVKNNGKADAIKFLETVISIGFL